MSTEAKFEAIMRDMVHYISSPYQLLWRNFVAGVMRGLGATVGAMMILALVVWLLTKMAQLPWVGDRIAHYNQVIQEYAEESRYADDLSRLEIELKGLREDLAKLNEKSEP